MGSAQNLVIFKVMQVFDSKNKIPRQYQGGVLTLGNFDGLHLGHRELVGAVVDQARQWQVASVVMTFEPHPVKVLQPEKAFRELFPPADLPEQLEQLGVSALIVENFDLQLARLSAEIFLQKLVVGKLSPRKVIVGYDFRFGHERQGDLKMMTEFLSHKNILVQQMQAKTLDEKIISSSAVREALARGDVFAAESMLGRPFELRGVVVGGDQRGRRLGFPTANLNFENEIVPRVGVYLTEFIYENRSFNSLTNVGYRPTFEKKDAPHNLSVESFLIDQDIDLYAKPARVKFRRFVRDEQAFTSPDALVEQINKDLATARQYFSKSASGSHV